MSTTYRVGVIASGRIAQMHGRGWTECEHTRIVAIADTHPQARDEYARIFAVHAQYEDYRQMLEKEELDIVSVCSWDPQHAEMTIAACAAQPRVVLCEKPMACSLGEAEAMIIAAQRNKVKLAIGHQRRFYSSWNEARRLVQEGFIGKPRHLWSAVKGGMLNTGTHSVDFQLYVLGDPRAEWVMGQVERKTDHYVFGHRVEDRCAGIVGYPGEVEGVLENEMNSTYQLGANVYGTEGLLEVRDNSLKYLTKERAGWQVFTPEEEVRTGYGVAFTDQANEICAWIEDRVDDYRGDAKHGKAALEIMMGVYESARMHERVALPLQTRANPLDVAVESGVIPVERPGVWDERSFLVRGESMSWLD